MACIHDDIHGTTHFNTLFRNHFYGDIWNNPKKDSNTAVISLFSYGRFFNVVGNVLGRTGYYTTYESNLADNPRAIFMLGESPQTGVPDDPQVKTTLMRWGNYDTVTETNRFLASEAPSGLSKYANPAPASQILPASFYLSAKPSWFRTIPWPAIGPDVTGGSETAGRAYKNPARVCWEQTAIDTAYGAASVRLFSPAGCYGQSAGGGPSGPPNPPSDLVVQ